MMHNPSLKIVFTVKVNTVVENKFLLDDKIDIDLRISSIFLIIFFFVYLVLCILIYITKSLIAIYFVKSFQSNKGKKTNKEEQNPTENTLIHSLHVKYYIFFNKLPLVESYVENNILIDDKTYREFFRNMLNEPNNYDVLKSFEEVNDKSLSNKGAILSEIIIIVAQLGLLIITHYVLFYVGGVYTKYLYYFLIFILVIIFIRFLKLIILCENVRYLTNQLLTSRDKKFLSQETNIQI
jgi:hypothetical protein